MTQDINPIVRSWLDDTISAAPGPVRLHESVADQVHRTSQRRGRLPQLANWGFRPIVSVTRFALAGVIVALFGGFLLAGVLTQPSEERAPAVGASASPSTTDDLLSRFDTSEVSPGVLRIISENVGGDLEDVAMAIAKVDGSVWSGRDGRSDFTFAGDGTQWEAMSDPFRLRSFDGETWTQHRAPLVAGPDPLRWPPDNVKGFAAHPDGSIWVIGTRHGDNAYSSVQRLGPDGWTVESVGDGLPSLSCAPECGEEWNIVITPDGMVWVSIDLGGLLRFDGTDWEIIRPLGGDEDYGVISLAANRGGVLWAEVQTADDPDWPPSRLGEGRRLARFDGDDWEVLYPPATPELLEGRDDDYRGPSEIQAVGPDGTVWLTDDFPESGRALGRFPVSFDGERWDRYPELMEHWASDPLNESLRRPGVSHIVIGQAGAAWVAVQAGDERGNNAGLYVITPDEVEPDE